MKLCVEHSVAQVQVQASALKRNLVHVPPEEHDVLVDAIGTLEALVMSAESVDREVAELKRQVAEFEAQRASVGGWLVSAMENAIKPVIKEAITEYLEEGHTAFRDAAKEVVDDYIDDELDSKVQRLLDNADIRIRV